MEHGPSAVPARASHSTVASAPSVLFALWSFLQAAADLIELHGQRHRNLLVRQVVWGMRKAEAITKVEQCLSARVLRNAEGRVLECAQFLLSVRLDLWFVTGERNDPGQTHPNPLVSRRRFWIGKQREAVLDHCIRDAIRDLTRASHWNLVAVAPKREVEGDLFGVAESHGATRFRAADAIAEAMWAFTSV